MMLEDDQQYFPMETTNSFDEVRATRLSREKDPGVWCQLPTVWQLLQSAILNTRYVLWEEPFSARTRQSTLLEPCDHDALRALDLSCQLRMMYCPTSVMLAASLLVRVTLGLQQYFLPLLITWSRISNSI